MLPAHMVYWFCTFKNQARFPPPINKHRYDCERYRALKKGKNVHTKCYSKSSNSVNICSKNTSRYLKSHCLNLYYDVCEKSRYIEESRYFTYKIEYFGTKKLIAL